MQALGIVLILIEYLTWALLTVSYKSTAALICSCVLTCIGAAIWCKVLHEAYRVKVPGAKSVATNGKCNVAKFVLRLHEDGCRAQIGKTNVLLLVFGLLIAIAQAKSCVGATSVMMFALAIICVAVAIVGLVWAFIGGFIVLPTIVRRLKDNCWLAALLVIVVLLSFDIDWKQFKWDGFLYYMTSHSIDISSISSTAIYGHIAQSFGLLVGIAVAITGNVAVALQLMNIIVLCLMTIYSYMLIKYIALEYCDINLSSLRLSLLTAICVFSPFYLGMVNYYSLDFYLICLAPVFLYYLISRQWILCSIAGCAFVFTKEPALIFYVGCVAGMLCAEAVRNLNDDRMHSLKEVSKRILLSPKYYYLAVAPILWLVTYKLLGPWSAGDGGLVIDVEYIVAKLKCLYVLNYGWVFLLLIVVSFATAIALHKVKSLDFEWIIPICGGILCSTLFSCFFKTVNHPRYVDAVPFSIYIIAIVLMVRLLEPIGKSGWQIISVGMAGLMLISEYITFDPLSLAAFDSVNIGNTKLIKTMEAPLGDGSIYNKQMLWIEHVMNEAIGDAVDMDAVVIMPNVGDSEYYFDGTAYSGELIDGVYCQTEYYDVLTSRRCQAATADIPQYVYGSGEFAEFENVGDYTPVTVCMPCKNASIALIDDIMNQRSRASRNTEVDEKGDVTRLYSVIYLSDELQPHASSLCDELEVIAKKQYNYRGWTLNAVTGYLK